MSKETRWIVYFEDMMDYAFRKHELLYLFKGPGWIMSLENLMDCVERKRDGLILKKTWVSYLFKATQILQLPQKDGMGFLFIKKNLLLQPPQKDGFPIYLNEPKYFNLLKRMGFPIYLKEPKYFNLLKNIVSLFY